MAKRKRSDSDYWGYFPRSSPIPVEDGIRARSQRGDFAEHWWARRWVAELESFGWANRMQRGRSYARQGQVLRIDVSTGRVTAQVQGSRRRPYDVRIEIRPLASSIWEQVVDVMANQALFAAQLLAGEMPLEIEEAFRAANAALFPTHYEIQMNCSCPDWAVPCKHIAAVYYLLGEEFDRDPFLLFTLRGRTREQVVAALRERRAAAAEPGIETVEREAEPPGEPLETNLEHFWELQKGIANVTVTVTPPTVETALLKRLGPPAFAQRREAFVGALTLAYTTVTERALSLAFGEESTEAVEG